ncbi:MAG: alcohol dehydrogenase catalytic domain-containing protein, partial [Actinomyces sp.]|nr:alcohol dehydrogenase catalytic domain-containing protein [Actinomyces sp.]
MADTMLAERFHAETREVRLEEVPVPEPGAGQVRIKVAYCGICHSDLSLISGAFPAPVPVVTQGHEAAGVIDKIGPGVTRWEVGDRVIPSAGRPCLQCRRCRRGDFTNCLNLQLMA